MMARYGCHPSGEASGTGSKDDLLATIVLGRIDKLNAVGEQLLDAADPWAALLEFLTVAADRQQQRDLSFLQEAGDLNADVTRAREQMFRTVHKLVDRARENGAAAAGHGGPARRRR